MFVNSWLFRQKMSHIVRQVSGRRLHPFITQILTPLPPPPPPPQKKYEKINVDDLDNWRILQPILPRKSIGLEYIG